MSKEDGGARQPLMHPWTKDGGPAFPIVLDEQSFKGMSLRAYAAIQLRQPDSGIDWLDQMILKARRDDLAAKAMQSICGVSRIDHSYKWIAHESIRAADAMLAAGRE